MTTPTLFVLAQEALTEAFRLRGEYLLSQLGEPSVFLTVPSPYEQNGELMHVASGKRHRPDGFRRSVTVRACRPRRSFA